MDLERSTLERKDRAELATIAETLGRKPTSRAKKSDIVDLILELTGVTSEGAAPTNGNGAVTADDAPVDAPAGSSDNTTTTDGNRSEPEAEDVEDGSAAAAAGITIDDDHDHDHDHDDDDRDQVSSDEDVQQGGNQQVGNQQGGNQQGGNQQGRQQGGQNQPRQANQQGNQGSNQPGGQNNPGGQSNQGNAEDGEGGNRRRADAVGVAIVTRPAGEQEEVVQWEGEPVEVTGDARPA